MKKTKDTSTLALLEVSGVGYIHPLGLGGGTIRQSDQAHRLYFTVLPCWPMPKHYTIALFIRSRVLFHRTLLSSRCKRDREVAIGLEIVLHFSATLQVYTQHGMAMISAIFRDTVVNKLFSYYILILLLLFNLIQVFLEALLLILFAAALPFMYDTCMHLPYVSFIIARSVEENKKWWGRKHN